jgi:hypothetical protein
VQADYRGKRAIQIETVLACAGLIGRRNFPIGQSWHEGSPGARAPRNEAIRCAQWQLQSYVAKAGQESVRCGYLSKTATDRRLASFSMYTDTAKVLEAMKY